MGSRPSRLDGLRHEEVDSFLFIGTGRFISGPRTFRVPVTHSFAFAHRSSLKAAPPRTLLCAFHSGPSGTRAKHSLSFPFAPRSTARRARREGEQGSGGGGQS